MERIALSVRDDSLIRVMSYFRIGTFQITCSFGIAASTRLAARQRVCNEADTSDTLSRHVHSAAQIKYRHPRAHCRAPVWPVLCAAILHRFIMPQIRPQ